MADQSIGFSIPRKEAPDKVTGAAKYNDDYTCPGLLQARLYISPHAHAKIRAIDTCHAWTVPGVRAVITGEDFPILCGTVLEDRPPLALGKVRYFGEPVVLVVADTEAAAKSAVDRIIVEYEPLPVVNSISDAVKPGAVLVHENPGTYNRIAQEVKPQANTNINNLVKIRKGDIQKGWSESEIVVEAVFKEPQSDHIAMETRNARAQILPNGEVHIHSSSQAPFTIRKQLSNYFNIEMGKVVVHVPLVGGGFGGKAALTLEILAYMASKAVGGRPVKLTNTREEDMISSPCRMGLEAVVKLGAARTGQIKAAEIKLMVESGAYSDTSPRLAKAAAVDCTGPYNIENLWCDSLSVYTNHPYATSYRGFSHAEYTFCIERALDKLAYALNIDPIDIRLINAILPGHFSPTQVKLTPSNLGNVPECISKIKGLINWTEGPRLELGHNKIRSKGISCFWKTSDSPPGAISGAIITFVPDGTLNLNIGAVEIGPGTKTTAAQILAEKMKMDINKINIEFDVNTRTSPHHWKTVASMSTFLVGRAVLAAADDAIQQIRHLASIALRCPEEDLVVADGRVSLRDDPDIYVDFTKLVHSFKFPSGHAVGGEIIGRGSFVMRHLTPLDPETGQGKPGPYWTVGAQAVEIEFDSVDCTYRLIKAATVLDAGKVINPKTSRGLITGGMCMGLGLGSREAFIYGNDGQVQNTSLRSYKPMRFGENPEYLVDFAETPALEAPYGARGFAEHGIIGMPAALANALSAAAQVELNELPLTPELIWKTRGKENDTF